MTSSQHPKPFSARAMSIALGLIVVVAVVAIYFFTRHQRLDTPLARDAMKYMRSDLEGLIFAEATTHRLKGQYVTDPDQSGYIRTVGVDKPVISITGEGWTAVITASAVPGLKCAVGIDAKNPVSRSAKSGEIVCE